MFPAANGGGTRNKISVASDNVKISSLTEQVLPNLGGTGACALVMKFIPTAIGEVAFSGDLLTNSGSNGVAFELLQVNASTGGGGSEPGVNHGSRIGPTIDYRTAIGTAFTANFAQSTQLGNNCTSLTYVTYTGTIIIVNLSPIYIIVRGYSTNTAAPKCQNLKIMYDVVTL